MRTKQVTLGGVQRQIVLSNIDWSALKARWESGSGACYLCEKYRYRGRRSDSGIGAGCGHCPIDHLNNSAGDGLVRCSEVRFEFANIDINDDNSQLKLVKWLESFRLTSVRA